MSFLKYDEVALISMGYLIFLPISVTLNVFFFGKIMIIYREVFYMKRLTYEDIEQMKKADVNHEIFDETGKSLTKYLPLSKIEEIFPDSLLILSNIMYGIDKNGVLGIEKATVEKFCEFPNEAEKYLNDNLCSMTSDIVPYHTGLTKFSHPKPFNEREVPLKYTPDTLPNYNSISKRSTRLVKLPSIKDIDLNPLLDFFRLGNIPEDKAQKVLESVREDIERFPSCKFDLKALRSAVSSSLRIWGYNIDSTFEETFHNFAVEHYPRLVARENIIIFHSSRDKAFLTDYCIDKGYQSYSYIKAKKLNDLLLVMLRDECKKVVIESRVMERLSRKKLEVLGLTAVKCEVAIEIVSMETSNATYQR